MILSHLQVATGEVDMALGADQGGSIRIPAAWTGTVGLKPTFGLVPYTGLVPIEPTVDHAGPITRNVTDCALFLEVCFMVVSISKVFLSLKIYVAFFRS